MTGVLHDIRFAMRQFAARPLFTLTAIATVALGIGANTAIFSVVNGLLLNPLPYADADRLAYVWRSSPSNEMMLTPDGELIEQWREGSRSFDAIEAWHQNQVAVRTAAGPRALNTAAISDGLLSMLGVSPALGRAFERADEAATAPPVVMLSYGFWQAEYGGVRNVIGRSLVVGGTPHTIVGVAPAVLGDGIEVLSDRHLWLPLRRNAEGRYAGSGIHVMVRLHEGVTRERAEADLSAIAARTAEARGDANFPAARLMMPEDMLGSATRRALLVLLGAVAFVLLIACANVANLLLVRAGAREMELAIRAALGAGRGRLLRQLLVESVLLGAAGGVAGFVLAYWGLDLIVAIRPERLPELERVRINGQVASFAALLALGTGVLFGLLPALRAARGATLQRAGTRTIAGTRATRRMTGGLIVAEVALSLLLLVGAGLLVRTFLSLQATPLRFDPAGLWTATVQLPPAESGDGRDDRLLHERLRDAVAALPGVHSAQLVSGVPSGYGISFGALGIDGEPPAEDAPTIFASNFVEPAYFRTLGMQFVEGRAFTESDGRNVVVVGEAFARRFFEGSAIGHTIRLGEGGEWRTIIGVAADLPAQGLPRSGGFDQLHFPAGSFPLERLLIDSDLTAAALAPALRDLLADLQPGAALAELDSVQDLLAGSLDPQRFNFILLLTLAALATILSAVGLYGVVGVAVSGRTREIGIRRALGATDASVVRLAIREGLRPALVGLLVGFAGALALSRLMSGMLYGLSPHDPITLATVPAILGVIALFASWLPGRRAARIQPVEALRIEG